MSASESISLAVERYEPTGPDGTVPLVIAHGLFGSARNFATLAKRLAARRTVVCVDMRNHGVSPWAEQMDYEAMGGDLLAVIERDAEGCAALLGHSMGGKAAMAAALLAPARVERLLVADIAPVAYAHSHAPYIAAMQGVDLPSISRRSEADPLLAAAVPEAPLRAFLLQNLVMENGRARWRVNLSVIEREMAELTGWPEALASPAYAGPALFYHGGASDYVTDDARAAIAHQFPRATIEAMPGAGHWLHAEQPALFAERVEAWLAAA